MISVDKALQIIMENTRVLEPERIPVLDSLGKVLSEDVVAAEDYPPFDKSAIDGFALKGADIARCERARPVELILDGDIRVGEAWEDEIRLGHAIKVASGAPLPRGADTVVSADFAVRESSKKVRIYKGARPGEHIELKGDEVERGSVVFSAGRVVSATDIALLGSIGIREVCCHRRPRVSFFASGNDLISPDGPPEAGKMRAGATYSLPVQLARYGAEPVNLGILDMTPEVIKSSIEKGMQGDMMIVTSGASGSDFDHLKIILQKYGLDLKFWRVAIKPGNPFAFGTFDGVPLFGFSDNVPSSILLLEQFVKPSLMKMRGICGARRTEVVARLEKEIRGGSGMTHFIGAEVKVTDDGFSAAPVGSHNHWSMRAFYTVNGFIVLPPEIKGMGVGERVKVQIITEPTSSE